MELQLNITDLLPPTAIISLRLTGRYFYHLLPNPRQIDPVEMSEFTRLKGEDNYGWNCRREQAFGIDKSEKLTCSKCRCLHPRVQFSRDQLRVAQARRACIGAEGVIQICQHSSFTFDEVTSLLQKNLNIHEKNMYDFRICIHPSHGCSGKDLATSAPMLGVVPKGGRAVYGSFIVSRTWTIAQVSSEKPLTQATLEKELSHLNELICPHTSTRDAITGWLKDASRNGCVSHYPFYISQLDVQRPQCDYFGACRVCTTFASFCKDTHCDTSWIFYRRHNDPSLALDEVVLGAKRYLGPGLGRVMLPQHSSWLAQIKPDRLTSEELEREDTCLDGQRFLFKYKDEMNQTTLYARSQGM